MELIKEYELDGKLYKFFKGGYFVIVDLDIEVEELTVKELRDLLRGFISGLYKMRKNELVVEVVDLLLKYKHNKCINNKVWFQFQ